MALYDTAQLYLGLATLVAALTIILYSRGKSAELDAESRRAFRPLYVVSVGLIVYAIGAFGTFIEEVFDIILLFDVYLFFYVGLAFEVIMLSIAAAMILNSRKLYSVPVATLVATAFLFYLALLFPDEMNIILVIGVIAPAIILVFVGSIFIWIARETKRSTSTALAFTLLIQIIGLPALYFDLIQGNLEIAFLFFLLMGPAMVAFTFLRPDQRITFELIGYGSSFAGPALILASLQEASIEFSIEVIMIAVLSALAAAVSAGTASYLYGRFTESRQIPTVIMAISLFLLADAQIIGTLGAFGVSDHTLGSFIEFVLSGFALALLAVAAIYASGKKSASLIPLLAYTPIAFIVMLRYPGSIGNTFLELWYLIIPVIAILLLPAIVFLGVWNRMRKENASGRYRPLGLALGIILYFVTRVPPLVIGLPGLDYGYGAVFISYFMMWLAFTGRLDKYLNRAK